MWNLARQTVLAASKGGVSLQQQLHRQPLRQLLLVGTTSSSCSSLFSTTPSLAISEQTKVLGKLRKKTGYSLSICKKALSENNNDLAAAEKWLKEQAQALGLAKAQKLQGRNTSQGLLGVKISDKVGAIVELNCETDFVANNSKFRKLLEEINVACVSDSNNSVAAGEFSQAEIHEAEMGGVVSSEGSSLSDLVALNIGQIGENMRLGGGVKMCAGEGVSLSCLTHPTSGKDTKTFSYGRFACLLAYRAPEDSPEVVRLAREVCQHIIGMAPTCVSAEEDPENSLLHQSFLLEEELKVGEVLEAKRVEVLGFVRREVGRSGDD